MVRHISGSWRLHWLRNQSLDQVVSTASRWHTGTGTQEASHSRKELAFKTVVMLKSQSPSTPIRQRRRHGRLSLVTIRIQAVWQKAMDSPEMGFRFRRVSFSDKNLSRRYVALKCSSSCRSRCRTKDSTSFLDNPQVNGSFFHRSQALVNQRNPSNPGLPAGG